ncbi:hypothetical protein NFI96_002692 [Prochilodus magdalenae]|nr:hypothetical protein NFI96_002692 [Prochilodus magdalenae]
MIHHPHTTSVVVLWGSCPLKNRVIQYTEKQTDYSLDLYTYRVSCMVSGADRVDTVVKSVPSNLWILAVLTPVSLVMVVVVMAVAIICRRNRTVFKTSAFRGFHPRTKVRSTLNSTGTIHHASLCPSEAAEITSV